MTIVILFWIPGKKFIPFFNRFNKKFNLFFKQLFLLIIIQSKFSVKMFLKNGQHLKLTRRTSSMMGRRRLPSSSIIFCWINRRQLHSLPSFISLSLSLDFPQKYFKSNNDSRVIFVVSPSELYFFGVLFSPYHYCFFFVVSFSNYYYWKNNRKRRWWLTEDQ